MMIVCCTLFLVVFGVFAFKFREGATKSKHAPCMHSTHLPKGKGCCCCSHRMKKNYVHMPFDGTPPPPVDKHRLVQAPHGGATIVLQPLLDPREGVEWPRKVWPSTTGRCNRRFCWCLRTVGEWGVS
uniref:Secreted protein n=1 Tax=Eutreptiella gymnastica TaxID=73025 RepID=A0A7S1NGC8_9EUGL